MTKHEKPALPKVPVLLLLDFEDQQGLKAESAATKKSMSAIVREALKSRARITKHAA